MATSTITPHTISDPLSSPGLDVRAGSDGHVDLQRLERTAALSTVMCWIRLRLMRKDPYWPINLQDMEPPHDLFVNLAMRSGPNGFTRALIEESVCELLRQAWSTNPSWTGELLQLVRVLHPPCCLPFLESIVRQQQPFSTDQEQQGFDIDWLLTAASYQPTSLYREWLDMLRHASPRRRSIAYRALAQDWLLALQYLPDFANSMRLEDQPMLIRSAVRLAFERCRSKDFFLDKVNQNWPAYGEVAGLQGYVADALRSLNLPIPQPRSDETPAHVKRPQPRKTVNYAGAAMHPAWVC